MQRLRQHALIIIFVLFYFGITAYKFVAYPTPFYDWDESIYAQVGREMVQQKSLVPLWQGNYWLDKPPLVPLAYGIVETIIPLKPELSTRLFTLSLTILLFIFIYYFYFKLTKNIFVSFLTVLVSSFTGIFLQRAQVLNVDIFLFIGWMGYLVFFEHFWLSLLFLAIGVLSKSLLGFYPAIGMLCIFFGQIVLKQRTFHQSKKQIYPIILQMFILSFWFILMFLYFKFPFIQAQFLDSQLKRVTASIESHFGKRTFYIDLLFEQLGLFAYVSLISIGIIVTNFLRKKMVKESIYLLFFVPWFLFLNLTKTKINWYLYPVIPQFAFLGVYLISFLRKKYFLLLITLLVSGSILYGNFSSNSFLNTHYSTYDENYELSIYARDHCKELTILVDKDSRTTHDTLQKMNLLIHTSEWWGNHPAIVYYSNKKVNFSYSTSQFKDAMTFPGNNMCFAVHNGDISEIPPNLNLKKTFKELYLYQ